MLFDNPNDTLAFKASDHISHLVVQTYHCTSVRDRVDEKTLQQPHMIATSGVRLPNRLMEAASAYHPNPWCDRRDEMHVMEVKDRNHRVW
jgi:hypothetical protein